MAEELFQWTAYWHTARRGLGTEQLCGTALSDSLTARRFLPEVGKEMLGLTQNGKKISLSLKYCRSRASNSVTWLHHGVLGFSLKALNEAIYNYYTDKFECETLSVTLKVVHRLNVFQNNLLRIFGWNTNKIL